MSRRFFFMLLCVCALTAAMPALAETFYLPGVYMATAQGSGGGLTVEVTFDETQIASVTILEHSEAEGICEPAIESLPRSDRGGTDPRGGRHRRRDRHQHRHPDRRGGLRHPGGRRRGRDAGRERRGGGSVSCGRRGPVVILRKYFVAGIDAGRKNPYNSIDNQIPYRERSRDGPDDTRQPAEMHGGKSRSVHTLADKVEKSLFRACNARRRVFLRPARRVLCPASSGPLVSGRRIPACEPFLPANPSPKGTPTRCAIRSATRCLTRCWPAIPWRA